MKKFLLPMSLLFIACFIYTATGEEPEISLFPHTIHIEESGCSDCHTPENRTKKQSFPEKDICLECHDALPYDYTRRKEDTSQNQSFIFSHTSHSKTDCQACHTINTDSEPTIPDQVQCSKCHSAMGIKQDCSECHIKKFLPKNHGGLWRNSHARYNIGQGYTKKHGQDCIACHKQPVCTSCHKTVSPKSHTGFFRTRGHGLKASIEKKSCTTCHKESACIRCHRSTKPLNHKGQWQYMHGLAIPGGKTGSTGKCGVCHKQTWCVSCHNR